MTIMTETEWHNLYLRAKQIDARRNAKLERNGLTIAQRDALAERMKERALQAYYRDHIIPTIHCLD
jgi:hypothetical protein